MWIIEILQSEKAPVSRETTLYMLDFKQEKLKPQAITSNIGKYMVSLDNNYILYSTDTYFGDKSKLFCRNNKSKKEYLIEDNIVEYGFALSSGNIAAYLVKDEIGAQLYIKDYSDEKSESKLAYTFAEFLRVECIDFSSDGKWVFISYCENEDAKSLAEYQMCLINLGDF
jgi:protease II